MRAFMVLLCFYLVGAQASAAESTTFTLFIGPNAKVYDLQVDGLLISDLDFAGLQANDGPRVEISRRTLFTEVTTLAGRQVLNVVENTAGLHVYLPRSESTLDQMQLFMQGKSFLKVSGVAERTNILALEDGNGHPQIQIAPGYSMPYIRFSGTVKLESVDCGPMDRGNACENNLSEQGPVCKKTATGNLLRVIEGTGLKEKSPPRKFKYTVHSSP